MTSVSPVLRAVLVGVSCVSCVLCLPGCSWLFVEAPRAQVAPSQPVTCTRSKAAPIIDSVVTGLQTVRVVYALSQSEADYDDFPISRGADIGLGLGFTALFAASAVYGFSTTATCAAAQQRALAEPPPAPPTGAVVQPATPTPSADAACTFDAQCAGEDRCHEGSCVPTSNAAQPAPQTAPSSSP